MIYQCSNCSIIHNVSKPIASNKCGKCGGWLAQIDRTPDPISYVDSLGFREEVKQMDRIGPTSPSRQIYRKPDVTTEASKEKKINREGLMNSGRQNPPILPFIPANRRGQVLKETVQNTNQRGEQPAPKTGSPNRQDQSYSLMNPILPFSPGIVQANRIRVSSRCSTLPGRKD